MNKRNEAATRDTLIEITVSDLRALRVPPAWATCPFRDFEKQFSIITMASSTTNPTDDGERHQGRLSMENPTHHIMAQVPASASGTVMPAARVAAVRAGKTNTTNITSATVRASVNAYRQRWSGSWWCDRRARDLQAAGASA